MAQNTMKMNLITLGYQIPGHSDAEISFSEQRSLMDADIVVVSPEGIEPPSYDRWISFSSGGGCYDPEASTRFDKNLTHLRKEIRDFLKAGKSIFVMLSKRVDYTLSSGSSSPRKGERNYSTYGRTNYDFIPVDIGTLTSAEGNHVEFNGDIILAELYGAFKERLKYQAYIEGIPNAIVSFHGKQKEKILGARIKVGQGNLILLPYIDYDFDAFTKFSSEDENDYGREWTKEALTFGRTLTSILFRIQSELVGEVVVSPPPDWVEDSSYSLKASTELKGRIEKKTSELGRIQAEIDALQVQLTDEESLKGLLFAQGKPLENSVRQALKLMGYKAEGFDDGELELDQVIVSPEGHRYIGECEGKDNKDVNITKFRQLVESMNADFAREEVDEKAFGLLFGNPQRLLPPSERTLDFTAKCVTGAKREGIGLIKTEELFDVAKYLSENDDDEYRAACRSAIHNGLGSIIKFPKPKGRK